VPVRLISDSKGETLALVVTETLNFPAGHNFLTQPLDQLQFAVFNHPKGHVIQRHWHPAYPRQLTNTCEVLIIQGGKVEAAIYDEELNLVFKHILNSGDIAILLRGGHGFEILETSTILEIKQGPYAGVSDKEVF
jgi:hypothetical protein